MELAPSGVWSSRKVRSKLENQSAKSQAIARKTLTDIDLPLNPAFG
jgi:hypothetical protein